MNLSSLQRIPLTLLLLSGVAAADTFSVELEGTQDGQPVTSAVQIEHERGRYVRATRLVAVAGQGRVHRMESDRIDAQRRGQWAAFVFDTSGSNIIDRLGGATSNAGLRAYYRLRGRYREDLCNPGEATAARGQSRGHRTNVARPRWLSDIQDAVENDELDGAGFVEADSDALPARVSADYRKFILEDDGKVYRSLGPGLPLVIHSNRPGRSGALIYTAFGEFVAAGVKDASSGDIMWQSPEEFGEFVRGLLRERFPQDWQANPRYKTSNAIFQLLRKATKDAYVMSEGDAMFEPFFASNDFLEGKGVSLRRLLRTGHLRLSGQRARGAQAKIEERETIAKILLRNPDQTAIELLGKGEDDIRDFLDGRLYLEDDDQDETGAKQALKDMLSALTDAPVKFLRVLAVDSGNRTRPDPNLDVVGDAGLVEIYIFGVNRHGDLIGLKTFVVWT